MNQKVLVSNSGYPRRRKRFQNKQKVVEKAIKMQKGEFTARELTEYIINTMRFDAEKGEVRFLIPKVNGVIRTYTPQNKNEVDRFTYFGPKD
jgi:pyocin large subunit-like protein